MRNEIARRLTRRGGARLVVGAVLLGSLLEIAAVSIAIACTTDAQCNDGDACNGVEICNTSTMMCEIGVPASPDLDGDGLGDACDDADATLSVTKITLRRNNASQGDKSAAKGKGFFATSPPPDTSTPPPAFHLRIRHAIR